MQKTVLIVDDEKRMADSLSDLLTAEGYSVTTAYSGAEAIVLLDKQPFRVLVTDLRMQGLDGLDVIRYGHERHPRMLIIVITGHATTESAIEAVHFGVFDYIRKPFEFDHFRMAIEKAFHKLETDELREATAAMITHDIKVPLTSIIGFAAMMYDRGSGAFHPRAADFCDTIKANGQKILELIENYLTTCRIESGTLVAVPMPIDPRQLVLDVVEITQVEWHRHRREVLTHFAEAVPPLVMLDETLVFRAICNLLQNAIKYSSGLLPIEIEMETIAADASPLGTETLRISVINDTHHMLPADLDEVFERYSRGRCQHGIEGSGIGLFVVQAVAHAHGGRACAEVLETAQVRFNLLLPLKVGSFSREGDPQAGNDYDQEGAARPVRRTQLAPPGISA